MIYLFEDDYRDFKSKLLMHNLKGDGSEIFTCGIGNLKKAVMDSISGSLDVVYAWMDLPVGNISAYQDYCALRRVAIKHPGRLLCFPIPCMEYYFVKSVADGLVVDAEAVSVCKSAGYHKNTLLYRNNESKCKSFENYSKLVLRMGFKDCVSVTRCMEDSRCFYFGKDCVNDSCNISYSLLEKGSKVAGEFGFLPDVFGWELSVVDVFEQHRSLVDLYNRMCDLYKSKDAPGKYVKVNYFPVMNGG